MRHNVDGPGREELNDAHSGDGDARAHLVPDLWFARRTYAETTSFQGGRGDNGVRQCDVRPPVRPARPTPGNATIRREQQADEAGNIDYSLTIPTRRKEKRPIAGDGNDGDYPHGYHDGDHPARLSRRPA